MVDEDQDVTAIDDGNGLTDRVNFVILNNNYCYATSSFNAVKTDGKDAAIKFGIGEVPETTRFFFAGLVAFLTVNWFRAIQARPTLLSKHGPLHKIWFYGKLGPS